MKYIINVLLYVALGLFMQSCGITPRVWQYWAVLFCSCGLSINALLW